jgi:molybdopterin molybdotransferase
MLLSVKAESIVLELAQPLDESAGCRNCRDLLAASAGRFCCTRCAVPSIFPYWDNSAMDGYAVRFADLGKLLSTENQQYSSS